MRQVNWRDFQEQCDELLGLVTAESITVLKSGKPIAVVIPPEEYEHLQRLDDAYWIARAEAAESRADLVDDGEAIRRLETVTREVQDFFADATPRKVSLSDELSRDRRSTSSNKSD